MHSLCKEIWCFGVGIQEVQFKRVRYLIVNFSSHVEKCFNQLLASFQSRYVECGTTCRRLKRKMRELLSRLESLWGNETGMDVNYETDTSKYSKCERNRFKL